MDENGNLTPECKEKLAIFLLKLRIWWLEPKDNTMDLIESFEEFRRELEED